MAKRKRPPELMGGAEKRARGIPQSTGIEELKRDISERGTPIEEQIREREDELIRLAETFAPTQPKAEAPAAEPITEKQPIGTEEVLNAAKILKEYKRGKSMLDLHIIEDEKWWELRHWEQLNAQDGKESSDVKRGEIDAKSAYLFSNVINKHADFMDAVPTFAVLPREQSDERGAKILSSVLPVIFEQNDFEGKYSNATMAKCKHGTGAYGVFFDGTRRNGLGDIVIDDIDVLRLFWQPGVKDIQDSENLFYVIEVSKNIARAMYPELEEKMQSAAISGDVDEYDTLDYVDKTDKVEIVEWYYKKNGLLHYCKFVGDTVIAATENDPKSYPNGLYKHGEYPFYIDRYFPMQNSPAGFGIIDIGKSEQEQIDRMSRALAHNVLGSSKQKTFISQQAGINTADLADPDKDIITVAGDVSERNLRYVQPQSNADVYMNVIAQKVAQMKETSGNTDVANGNTPSGITAASAIAALQEQAGKTSRDAIKASYRVFTRIAKCVIALILEFYETPRIFRITGEDGGYTYQTVSNKDFTGSSVKRLDGTVVNLDPEYDIMVSAQRSSSYSAMAQNELALQFYNAGFFAPQNADMATATLEMMDFTGKDKIITKISQNGTLYSMVKVLSERLAKAEAMLGVRNTATAAQSAGKARTGNAEIPELNAEGTVAEEPENIKKARERAATSAIPN